MATATAAAAKKAASTPAPTATDPAEPTGTEPEEAKRVRVAPKAVFEVVEALPENAPRESGGGGFQAKWPGLIQEVKDGAPVGAWAKRMVYETSGGARAAANYLEQNPEVFPVLDGNLQWLVDDRKEMVDSTTNPGEQVRGSVLYVGMFDPTQHSDIFQAIMEKRQERAEAAAKREATMKERGTSAGRPKNAEPTTAAEPSDPEPTEPVSGE